MKRQWMALWNRLGASGDPEPIYADLVQRYSGAGRAYHNLRHIEHCLTELASFPEPCADRDTIEFAVWFHDAIYATKAKDNEEQSAELARAVAHNANLTASFADTVTGLILTTKHSVPPTSAAAQLIVDVDLAILGQPQPAFDKYERQIREEYDWVPAEDFRKGRAAILARFANRPNIYATEHFHELYENQARENLIRSLQQLG